MTAHSHDSDSAQHFGVADMTPASGALWSDGEAVPAPAGARDLIADATGCAALLRDLEGERPHIKLRC